MEYKKKSRKLLEDIIMIVAMLFILTGSLIVAVVVIKWIILGLAILVTNPTPFKMFISGFLMMLGGALIVVVMEYTYYKEE